MKTIKDAAAHSPPGRAEVADRDHQWHDLQAHVHAAVTRDGSLALWWLALAFSLVPSTVTCPRFASPARWHRRSTWTNSSERAARWRLRKSLTVRKSGRSRRTREPIAEEASYALLATYRHRAPARYEFLTVSVSVQRQPLVRRSSQFVEVHAGIPRQSQLSTASAIRPPSFAPCFIRQISFVSREPRLPCIAPSTTGCFGDYWHQTGGAGGA